MLSLYCATPLKRGVTVLCLISSLLGRAGASPVSNNTSSTNSTSSTQVQLSSGDAANFQSALASLSAQAHVTIVSEGMPLKPHLEAKVTSSLTKPMETGVAITALATAYDYDAQQTSGVFVLTKKYSDPRDLPCVTLAECREAAKNIVSVLDVFSPHFAESVYANGPRGEKDAIVNFFAGLSSSQLKAAEARTLQYGTLSPDQQSIVKNLFLFMFIQQPGDGVADASNSLAAADKGTITLRAERGDPGLFLALPGTFSANLTYVTLLNKIPLINQQGAPIALPTPVPNSQENLPPVTLGAIVAKLDPISGRKPVAAPSISGKPAMAFGVKYTTPKNVMLALAALYGLHNGVSTSGGLQLEPLPVTLPLDISQLNTALWTAVPVSYDRILHLQTSSDGPTNGTTLPSEIQEEAGRLLLAAIQPQIKKSGQLVRVPVPSLNESAKDALAVLLMPNLISELQYRFTGHPNESIINCLGNMNQTIIYTDPNAAANVYGQIVPSFNLIGTDPYTNKQIGLGGVQYFSHN